MSTKYCPHCQNEISYLDWEGTYRETVYGSCNGTYILESGDYETDNQEGNDSDNYQEDVESTSCPECNHELSEDDVLDEDDVEEDEDGNLIFASKTATIPYVPPKRPSIMVKSLIKVI